ncbi:LppM family (lipo)protein [Micromonospora sp. NPDC000089]|uniref:LppM family (lipo)protein n=1 Tax=unclassified Micromonospora TaxID=2617518 RepID=UPI00369C1DF0
MMTGHVPGRAFRVAVCLALVALLAGCMQLNVGLTVNADDTVDGQLLLTAEKSLLTNRNPNVVAAFADMRQYIPPLPPGEETVYQDSRYYGTQISYRHTPLKDFTSGSIKLSRDNDLYRFSFPLDPTKYGGKIAEQTPQSQQAFLKLMSFEISVTFPGRVIDSNGTVSGRSVTWQVPSQRDKPTELRAVAEAPPRPSNAASPAAAAGDGGGFPWLIVGGGLVLVLVAGGVVAVLLLRRRRRPGAATSGPAPAAAGPAPAPPVDHPGPA